MDAFFSIPLHKRNWRYTWFKWNGTFYEYLVIMFELGASAHVFTKVLKSVIKFLRSAFGILILAYIYDLLIQASDKATCPRHAQTTVLVLRCFGYGVNFLKSLLTPSKSIKHVGLI